MNISLTPALKQYIQNKLNTGLYTSASEIVRESLRMLHKHEQSSGSTPTLNEDKRSYVDELKAMVLNFFKNEPVNIYLFGSRARGNPKRASDVDIAIEAIKPIKSTLISELKDMLEESHIPYNVDVVDFNSAEKSLKESIKKEGVLWKDYNND